MKPFSERLEELLNETIFPLIREQCLAAYELLSEKEKGKLDSEDNARFPKIVVNAVLDSKMIDQQIGAEGTKKDTKKVKKKIKKGKGG